jgi:hypothetical protein
VTIELSGMPILIPEELVLVGDSDWERRYTYEMAILKHGEVLPSNTDDAVMVMADCKWM